MSEGKIAVRYAKALFGAADDKGILDKIKIDVDALLSLDQDVPEFRDLLESPVLNTSQKQDVFSVLLKEKVEDLSLKFVLLLAENKREVFLPAVCRVFIELYKEKKGIKAAIVITASVLHESTAEGMKKSLEDFYECSVELKTQIKPELIGGYILRIDDQQLDASVIAQLKKIRKGMDQSVIS